METTVFNLILDRLKSLAKGENIRILYACESGSRAWGFPSPDSDYDIRIIYAHPIDWYLSVEESRDVIEQPIEKHILGELDVAGWDIRKTLRLAKKSNPVIWEWLQSPIAYYTQHSNAIREMRDGIESCFSPIAACYHYLSICRGTMDRELGGDAVKIKKYFYMLRPVLAASWIEKNKAIPPMEFQPLLQILDGAPRIRTKIDELLERKQYTDERMPISREPLIDAYLESELKRLTELVARLPGAHPNMSAIDILFRKSLGYSIGDV